MGVAYHLLGCSPAAVLGCTTLEELWFQVLLMRLVHDRMHCALSSRVRNAVEEGMHCRRVSVRCIFVSVFQLCARSIDLPAQHAGVHGVSEYTPARDMSDCLQWYGFRCCHAALLHTILYSAVVKSCVLSSLATRSSMHDAQISRLLCNSPHVCIPQVSLGDVLSAVWLGWLQDLAVCPD
jgi:hypothetical protein